MDFRKITIEDKEWIKDRLAVDQFYGAEYCFSTMFNWQDFYHNEIAKFEGFAVIRSRFDGVTFGYFGAGDRLKLIQALEEEAAKEGVPLRLHSILEPERQRLEEQMPGKFLFEEDRVDFDYCYTREKLAELKGRKLAAKRNHIKHFLVSCPDWSYEPITEKNLPECRAMSVDWYKNREETTGEKLEEEQKALYTAMDHFKEEELMGGLLRVGEKVEAFTLASAVNKDTVVVHFEKANLTYPGCYPMINQQFVEKSCQNYSRINREDDMGSESLRKAKESYVPDEMLVKYDATLAR